ncbi:MAG: hypothetical protein GWN61_12655 [candidate division Zixibacteria bacterium]|nr:hypothetical protein [candidate division Zixibacteria bacterium]NIS46835.1 hypothetical protein [candidate division Zixibacteria bacterium]NIU14980.1 hypothetical protein [candidate division Zixibacteria bacterium]NIV06996.1 hypothetical protein [candidate division Zixibacteria bacterium]NIW42329.1 hypothetical protein [candidate division Zixibacteria bacterium]
MKKITKTVLIILSVLLISAVLALPQHGYAASGKKDNVRYTGDHKRNVRTLSRGGAVETVKGTIFRVSGMSIIMDGESFYLSGADIFDQLGFPVKPEELYPGLKVHVMIKYGSVYRVSVKNFSRADKRATRQLQERRDREAERLGR